MFGWIWRIGKLGVVAYYHAAKEEIARSKRGEGPGYYLPFFPYERYFPKQVVRDHFDAWHKRMQEHRTR